jgi:hypothetical protein
MRSHGDLKYHGEMPNGVVWEDLKQSSAGGSDTHRPHMGVDARTCKREPGHRPSLVSS